MPDSIYILPANEIEESKWNHCIDTNSNGLIYSLTYYLDAMSENWHGLIIGNYRCVMPLPWKKKLCVRYGYTPPFMQQLGLSGDVQDSDWQEILSQVYRFNSLSDIHFNFSNTYIPYIIPISQRTNFVIDFSADYDTIMLQYKQDVTDNIKKAGKSQLVYQEGYYAEAIELYIYLYAKRISRISTEQYQKFSWLCELLSEKGQCITRKVVDNSGSLLCSAVLLKDAKRIYNIMNATSPEGRRREANYFLLDNIIREFSGSGLLFDFEGSDLPGVQKFYQKFGAINQPYFHYHANPFPGILRFFKD